MATLSKHVNLNVAGHRERIQFTITDLKNGHDLLLDMPWLQDHNPAVDWATRQLILTCGGKCFIVEGEQLRRLQHQDKTPKVHIVSAVQFLWDCKSSATEAMLFLIREKRGPATQSAGQPNSARLRDLLHKYQVILVDGLPPGLPPKRAVDHRIELVDETVRPPHRPCYRMSLPELEESKR